MSKTLLLAALAGVLSACTITINGSGSEGNTSFQNTSGSGGTGDTSEDPGASTTPTSEPLTTTTEEAPTTDAPTTGASTSEPVATGSSGGTSDTGGTTVDADTTADSDGTASEGSTAADTTTGGGGHGLCGWNAGKTYYACTSDDGVPGLADPKGNYEIDCPDQELAAGAACEGVGAAGCCLPTGDLYYCADGMLVLENCGA